jgi:uncharacterized protein with NAD-binding domain and iron-sulfur cluster
MTEKAASGATIRKRKVAVLGGGCGSMAAVWALTRLPDWRSRYDITVYQTGWRLGGKGASGREAACSDRILEHGLHVWAGFYENAFRVMQECYGELDPAPDNPIRSWTDAFKKLDNVVLEEDVEGKWVSWLIDLPENGDVPGTGGEMPSLWDYLELLVNMAKGRMETHGMAAESTPLADQAARQTANVAPRSATSLASLTPATGAETDAMPAFHLDFHPHDILSAAKHFFTSLHRDPNQHDSQSHHTLIHLLEQTIKALEAKVEADFLRDDTLRRLFTIVDIALSTVKGILADGVLFLGFEAVNHYEWREWLKRHGARELTLQSALVRGIYDYIFGYMKGRSDVPLVEAGTATHGVLRLFFTFKGSVFWEMQAGMGDIVFAPMYTVLERSGVKFEFFNKVENLTLDGKAIATIELRRQAEPANGRYAPLVTVKGLPAWPSEPRWEQLVDGERLAGEGINFESSWSPKTGTTQTLRRGSDFDDVILGISLGALPDICGELIAAEPRFRRMVEEVKSVQTAATQLWLDPDAAAIGAPVPHRAATSYAQELNTWSDMSFLLERENWPPDDAPKFIAYFCSQFPDADVIPPYDDHGFPARELERYREIAAKWLEQHVGHIWPDATSPGTPALDLGLLHDPKGRSGSARLDAQFFRVNIEPTERYVVSLPGTSRFRLEPHESGFDNLFLTGDWVRTSINAGCVEAAVMAGLAAAAALSGEKIRIVGGLR